MDMQEMGWRVGVLRRSQLQCSDWQVRKAVQDGRLRRLRPGWFALPNANPEVVRAVSAGGCVSCVSALKYYEIWVPPTQELHMRWSAAKRPRTGRGCPARSDEPVCGAVDTPELAWWSAVHCLPLDEAVAVTDSALRSGLIHRDQLDALKGPVAAIGPLVDPRSESGTESLVRVRLQRQGIRVRPQVQIAGVGRVDLLVGDRLIIECDSRAHHTDASAYHKDRRRDRASLVGNYLVLRLSWEDVMFHWDEVLPDILALVRRDAHRSRVTLTSC